VAKLSNIGSRLGGAAASRLGGSGRGESERERLQRRDREVPWRGWYGSTEWRQLRNAALARDSELCPLTGRVEPRCRRTGVWLLGKGRQAADAPVVDHVIPHEGDARLFYDLDNLQTVAKGWHDKIKQARERRLDRAAFYPKWLRPSAAKLTIVCGPPAAGKSTWVEGARGPRDIVIDLDVIAAEISGEPLHRWSRDKWLNAALFRRNDMLGDLANAQPSARAWFIVGEPKPEMRAWWDQKLRPGRFVVILAPANHCIERAAAAGDRDMARAERVIASWWRDYRPRSGDIVINT
jgi:5-methylcytosine-specific restriction endonuclease McrA